MIQKVSRKVTLNSDWSVEDALTDSLDKLSPGKSLVLGLAGSFAVLAGIAGSMFMVDQMWNDPKNVSVRNKEIIQSSLDFHGYKAIKGTNWKPLVEACHTERPVAFEVAKKGPGNPEHRIVTMKCVQDPQPEAFFVKSEPVTQMFSIS